MLRSEKFCFGWMFSEEFALLDAFKSHGACVDCFMVDVRACVSRAWVIFFEDVRGFAP